MSSYLSLKFVCGYIYVVLEDVDVDLFLSGCIATATFLNSLDLLI